MRKVIFVKATFLRKWNGVVVVEHATEEVIRPARSCGTTQVSYKEIKPRNTKEALKSIYGFNSVFLCSKRL